MNRSRWALPAVMAPALLITLLAGCTDTDKDIPKTELKTVSAYNLTLDENATPKQVAYVLLRSLADDVTAAQNHEHEKQKEAFNLTFSLAAYAQVEKQIVETENRTRINKITSLGDKRDKKIFKFVKYWAPIVGHYIKSFDTDMESAEKNMQVELSQDGGTAHVYRKVAHDPAETDPEKQQTATLDITMVKEKTGVREYWRVALIGYRPKKANS
ncbi:MAG: hypothetical protein JSV03_05055 [Planctomycetota bacterium]|nr:MAG: hypothetical protein JSV03_05055 [Planctomycetota bacterium]